jgi:peptidoglycan-associated lipoprotein
VAVTSHGEAVLLVRTPDETYEPRNRRVEITIR